MPSHRDDDASTVVSARSGRSGRSFKSALGRSANPSVAESEHSDHDKAVSVKAHPLADLPEGFFVDPDEEKGADLRRMTVHEDIEAAQKAKGLVEFAWAGKGDGHYRKDHHRTAHRFVSVAHNEEQLAAVTAAMLQRKYLKVQHSTHGSLEAALHNLSEGLKRSALIARDATKLEHDDADLKEVHSYQMRSFHAQGYNHFFKAIAPKVFYRVRKAFGISHEQYVRMLEQVPEGYLQSGDFFFSPQSQICFKRVTGEEIALILSVLRDYCDHISEHPLSLLPRWLAIAEVSRPNDKGGGFFLVTDHLFHTVDDIHEVYDIKGCAVRKHGTGGRQGVAFPMPPFAHNPRNLGELIRPKYISDAALREVFKMQAQEEGGRDSLVLHEGERIALVVAVQHDTVWLAKMGIYNYSMLIGVHSAGPEDDHKTMMLEQGSPHMFGWEDPREDRFHIALVGPFFKWDAKAKLRFQLHETRRAIQGAGAARENSIVPPDEFALRMREMVWETFILYGAAVDYPEFLKRRSKSFKSALRQQAAQRHVSGAVGGVGSRAEPDESEVDVLGAGEARLAAAMAALEDDRDFDVDVRSHEEGEGEALAPTVRVPSLVAKKERPGLGLALGPGHFEGDTAVTQLLPSRAAARTGKIVVGDVVVAVGRPIVEGVAWEWTQMQGVPLKKVGQALQGEIGDLVRLLLRRPLPHGEEQEVVVTMRFEVTDDGALRRIKAETGEREEEATHAAVSEMASILLRGVQELIENPRTFGDGLTSPAEMALPWIDNLDTVDDYLQYALAGGYIMFNSPELPSAPTTGFQAWGVAYQTAEGGDSQDGEHKPAYKLVWMIKCASGSLRDGPTRAANPSEEAWMAYNLWVTTDPSPWLLEPEFLLSQNLLFPSFVQLVAALPQLRYFVNPAGPKPQLEDRPQPEEEDEQEEEEVVVEEKKTLYDMWCDDMRAANMVTGASAVVDPNSSRLDVIRRVPISERTLHMQEKDITRLDISAAALSSMVRPRTTYQHLSQFYPATMEDITGRLIGLDAEYPHGNDVTGMVDHEKEARRKKPSKCYKVELWKLSRGQAGSSRDEWRRRTFVLQKSMLCFESEKQYGHVKRVCNLLHSTAAVRCKFQPFPHAITINFLDVAAGGDDDECTLAAERLDVFEDFLHEISPHSIFLGRLVKT